MKLTRNNATIPKYVNIKTYKMIFSNSYDDKIYLVDKETADEEEFEIIYHKWDVKNKNSFIYDKKLINNIQSGKFDSKNIFMMLILWRLSIH